MGQGKTSPETRPGRTKRSAETSGIVEICIEVGAPIATPVQISLSLGRQFGSSEGVLATHRYLRAPSVGVHVRKSSAEHGALATTRGPKRLRNEAVHVQTMGPSIDQIALYSTF